jgi:hypothetical protein
LEFLHDVVGTAPLGGSDNFSNVCQLGNAADADIFQGSHVVADEILKDDCNLADVVVKVVLAEIIAVEKDGATVGS